MRKLFRWMYPKNLYFRGTQQKGCAELLNVDRAYSQSYNSSHNDIEMFSISIRDAFLTGRIGWFHDYILIK